ncbi:hypothetical protein RR46_05705 [Papilio xuthus]|uniref:Uncharacterized protein n=1 Tax=Papilio xuthus TaxID=66420 RepID=A0A194PVR8_PAPXU|nr:hypothetical protein RR46_05705 [Papilio xuthus]
MHRQQRQCAECWGAAAVCTTTSQCRQVNSMLNTMVCGVVNRNTPSENYRQRPIYAAPHPLTKYVDDLETPAAASASARVPGAFPCPPLPTTPSPSQFSSSSTHSQPQSPPPAPSRGTQRRRERGVGRGARGRRRASQKNIVNT